jgi:hypothetical protein
MGEPRIVDSVTLRHFGCVDRMDILQARVYGCAPPRWTEAVQSELLDHVDEEGCQRALAASFLGTAREVPMNELKEVFTIRRALSVDNRDSLAHIGEAESIWVADCLNGALITDDGEAFAYAERRLGSDRVLDSVDLLRESVAADEITTHEAKQVADAIRNSGRYLRAGHPPTLTPDYFFHQR